MRVTDLFEKSSHNHLPIRRKWRSVNESSNKYTLKAFLLTLDEQEDIQAVEKQAKATKKHAKWGSKEEAQEKVVKQLTTASAADAV